MYDKVSRLSSESLAKTNSGKLVTIISADIQAIERQMQIIPMTLSSPLINLVVYIIIGTTVSWEYSLIVFLAWVITIFLQGKATAYSKKLMVS
jgi:ABC-type multidrug transport system fused ATPase/permease subunit